MSTFGEKIRGWGYILLAGGFGIAGWELLSDSAGREDLPVGGVRKPLSLVAADRPAKNLPWLHPELHQTDVDVDNIDQRVALLKKLLVKAAKQGKIHEIATEMLAQKCKNAAGRIVWCVEEKACWPEVSWIFTNIRDPAAGKYAIRYTRDSVLADQFSDADRTLLKAHGGDCDDYTIVIGGLLMSVGHRVKIRVVQTEGEKSWNHVYLMTTDTFDGDKWRAVDCSMARPVGWEAPGASDVAATGKPSGIVLKVKDYDVE